MKNIILLFIISFFVGCTEKKETPEEIHNKEIKSLLKFGDNDNEVILISKPTDIEEYCIEVLKKDTINFTSFEIQQILEQIEKPIISDWSVFNFDNVKILDYKVWLDLFRGDLEKGWKVFQKEYGSRYLEISSPIFLKKYSYCLVFSHSHCGSNCGGGSFILYKKINGKWEMSKQYCNFMS